MGFSVNKTLIPAGTKEVWHYRNHLESCYCVTGNGRLINLESGDIFYIHPDTVYSLDKHEEHQFEAITDVVLISIFNPPLNGTEVHGKDNSYDL